MSILQREIILPSFRKTIVMRTENVTDKEPFVGKMQGFWLLQPVTRTVTILLQYSGSKTFPKTRISFLTEKK